MSRVGIIWTGWQCEDLLEASLAPWIVARAGKLGGHEYVICAVCCPFAGFAQPLQLDRTLDLIRQYKADQSIDTFINTRAPITEVQARGSALRWLVETAKVDLLWQVDSDEVYTSVQILSIAQFVESRPLITWFRLSLRNAVFTSDQYLVEPFNPPRIHRVHPSPDLVAHQFWDDNNLEYRDTAQDWGYIVRDVQMAHLTIPTSVAWVRHLSWLNDQRSRSKIKYQLDGRGWPECSFSWDDARGGLVFNDAYYRARGLPLPEVARDPSPSL